MTQPFCNAQDCSMSHYSIMCFSLYFKPLSYLNSQCWDFPGSSVVKTSPSNAGGAGSIPGQELRSHMPRPESQNMKQKQYCNKFNKVLKKYI